MKKGSLSDALKQVSRTATPEPPALKSAATATANVPKGQPNRQGKKAVAGYFDPAVSKQLKLIGLEQDKNLQDLLAEAFNDLFEKYGKSKLA